MRSLILVCAMGLACFFVPGCKSGEKGASASDVAASENQTYDCPMCKDKVVWSYNTKGLPTGKTIEHSCPSCKKVWGATLSAGNTCADCGKGDHVCPACAKAGGGK